MLTDEELKALDDWRFSRRMPSRASAVRERLKRGLAAEDFQLAGHGTKSSSYSLAGHGTKSSSYSVVEGRLANIK